MICVATTKSLVSQFNPFNGVGVERSCGGQDLKKAYYKASLEWHPDKNHDRLIEATQKFQEIQEAYRVLSDSQERAWYDRHRDEILRGGQGGVGGTYKEERLDVFQFFTRSCFSGFDDSAKGFYTVYRKVFDDLTAEERRASDHITSNSSEDSDIEVESGQNGKKREARNKKNVKISSFPPFGYSNSDYDSVVRPFYAFWNAFSSRKSYSWTEPFSTRNLYSRIERRDAEMKNRKAREAARRQRNEEVRQLVSYVERRDKRLDAERQRLAEAALAANERTKEQASKVRQRNFEQLESEWMHEQATGGLATKWANEMEAEIAHIEAELERTKRKSSATVRNAKLDDEKKLDEENDGEADSNAYSEVEGEEDEDGLHCIACEKSFASLASMKNHQASKRHKKQVSILRSILLEDEANSGLSVDFYMSENGRFSELLLSNCSETELNVSSEVKLTKRAKKSKRRIQRAAEKEEEMGIIAEIEPGVNDILQDESTTYDGIITNGDSVQKSQAVAESSFKKHKIICSICSEEFESKNKLFLHIKENGHAALKTVSSSAKVPRSKKISKRK